MLSAFQIDPLKLSSTKWTLGWKIYNVQAHLNPRWSLVIDRDACAEFWKQT